MRVALSYGDIDSNMRDHVRVSYIAKVEDVLNIMVYLTNLIYLIIFFVIKINLEFVFDKK